MVKYDEKFKQKVVDAYLAGEGSYRSIAKKFDIPSKANIQKWVSALKRFGKNGLIRKESKKNYPVQFKIDVIDYKLRTGESFHETAFKHHISEPSTVYNWLITWQREGIEGLSKTKGRPSMSHKSNKKDPVKELPNEQQLKKEIELLRAENAYLKKLRASGINIPNRLLKQNPESFTNSEKNSN